MVESLPKAVDFEHLSVPLVLEELEHAWERHGVERLWGGVGSDL